MRRRGRNSTPPMLASKSRPPAVSEAETMLGYAKVTAPFDGVITRKLADVGDLAMPGKPLLEIEAPTALRFEADLPEAILDRIKLGAKMQVKVASVSNPLEATVSEIAPVADPVSRTFQVKLDLPKADGLRTGQFGRVSVPVAEVKLLMVPKRVMKRGQMELVFVAKDGKAALRLVKTGVRSTAASRCFPASKKVNRSSSATWQTRRWPTRDDPAMSEPSNPAKHLGIAGRIAAMFIDSKLTPLSSSRPSCSARRRWCCCRVKKSRRSRCRWSM
jgi:pyruvate/2-oxoglutarate dehydrogenase complex dihydrolipoamide acyltransferase (E2) component